MNKESLHAYIPVIIPLLITLLICGTFITGKYIEVNGIPKTISVTGEGRVTAVPDIAILSFGVQTGRMDTSQDVMEKLASEMDKIIAAISKLGIEEKDIQTEYLNMYPAYDWKDGEQIPRGFEASQNLRVKVRELSKVEEVLSSATNAGANQAGGVSFTINDTDELYATARTKAIEDAKEKAQKLAENLGIILGNLQGFYEGGISNPTMPYSSMIDGKGGMGGGATVSLPAGEQDILATVNITYEIK